jgi:hypothetical protein
MEQPLPAGSELADLLDLFDDSHLNYDLREGVIYNRASTRLCLFSSDLLRGVYQAVSEESGEAWRVIFKNCGRIWGQRVIRRLGVEVSKLGLPSFEDLSVEDMMLLLEDYFRFHGWGRVRLNPALMGTRGIVQAELEDSLFAEVIEDQRDPDAMVCGMLGAMLSELSKADLDCVQTADSRAASAGDGISRFLITGRGRVSRAREMLEAGRGHAEIVENI